MFPHLFFSLISFSLILSEVKYSSKSLTSLMQFLRLERLEVGNFSIYYVRLIIKLFKDWSCKKILAAQLKKLYQRNKKAVEKKKSITKKRLYSCKNQNRAKLKILLLKIPFYLYVIAFKDKKAFLSHRFCLTSHTSHSCMIS